MRRRGDHPAGCVVGFCFLKTRSLFDRARTVAALVRARTVGFPAEKPGQHDPQRRAVDCASYLALRFCVFALKMRTHEAMRAYHKRR